MDAREAADYLTTTEAAQAANVTPATIRQWVRRGKLRPRGTFERSMLFDEWDVENVADRHRKRPPNIPEHFHNKAVPAQQAAEIAAVRPATIRSWVARGKLTPITPAGKRPQLFRVRDIIDARE